MDDKSRDFALFIDGLRIDRNMSREDLCEGITSLSQYKRYLRGDTAIPNDKLITIADKLSFSLTDLHSLYRSRQDKQFQKIRTIYTFTRQRKLKEALTLSNEMKSDVIISKFNQLFFDYCLIYIQHNLGMVSDIHVLGLYSELIGYPSQLSSGTLNWIEIQVLLEITIISARIENFEPTDFLYNLITSSNFIPSVISDKNYLPVVYSTLSRIFGMQNDFKKVIEITNIGIDYCRTNETFTALASLAMYRAYAYLEFDNKEQALESAKLAFMQLHIENKPNKFEPFKRSFEKNFNMKLEDLIKL